MKNRSESRAQAKHEFAMKKVFPDCSHSPRVLFQHKRAQRQTPCSLTFCGWRRYFWVLTVIVCRDPKCLILIVEYEFPRKHRLRNSTTVPIRTPPSHPHHKPSPPPPIKVDKILQDVWRMLIRGTRWHSHREAMIAEHELVYSEWAMRSRRTRVLESLRKVSTVYFFEPFCNIIFRQIYL